MNGKQLAAEKAVEWIEDGMVVGLGTGSTAYWAIQAIGRKVAEGLSIRAVATSIPSEELARELNIPLIPWSEITSIDVTIDGADEVDGDYHLVKGGGGALLREKITAYASKCMIVIVDENKLVKQLGAFGLPVEVVPFAWEMTAKHLEKLGCKAIRRSHSDGGVFITDNGNYIMDCHFGSIQDAPELEQKLQHIPGIVEHGLFIGLADRVIIGYEHGTVKVRERSS
ncbi:ribose-5-phosphate isomerase RpiA [Paenibacillus aquistagni]|uniref:Ribose-5-phosphate isomerase A n=1 Tax=Paenibacillus aquistagni TaxID=1852522 RepID=A0A1X7IUR4_9BACL|nr:ribose-5-phosphate isomerase RpiA [Paenibacillus aquistagni]NMM51048.1 ribose-5-phosphate isomerase RpiA [Paenibacillus aquistagni]SMG18634.1 ribose-5-phosphate isomerase [Paenibacillus aquistagni]